MASDPQLQSGTVSGQRLGSTQRSVGSSSVHRDPSMGNMSLGSGTAPSILGHEDRIQEYLFGKRVTRKPVTTLRGTGHHIPVKEAVEADFVSPRTTLNIAPVIRDRRRATFGAARPGRVTRDTVVNKDAVRRTEELLPADIGASTEMTAPVFSSFGKSRGGGWGPKPRPAAQPAFKPFVGDAVLKRKEPTEFTTDVPSTIRASTPARTSVARQRGSSQGGTSAGTTDRTKGWLKCGEPEAVPGPGAYFIP